MLIGIDTLKITKPINGIIHIGAHECEEKAKYNTILNIDDSKIIWIDALKEKVDKMKKQNQNIRIFHECISDTDNQQVSFMVTNNYQSSSMLNFNTHLKEHPEVREMKRISLTTKTLKAFYSENSLSPQDYNFMNLDIQGAELMALKGAGNDILSAVDYIYTEVNTSELYTGCALLPELDVFLKQFGFNRTLTKMTRHGWGDAFYVKEY
jgi:FkbM family methyltransferase